MSGYHLNQDFDVAASRIRHKALMAEMPAKLGVATYDPKWTYAWDFLIGQSPQSFYETLGRNIEGELSVHIDFMETGEDNFDIDIRRNGRIVFKSENKIGSDGSGKFIRFEEWVNEDIDSRHKGTGLNLFKNLFEIAEKGGIDHMQLRAGKEDGKYFWARHGFYLKDQHYRAQMKEQVVQNLSCYSDTLPAGIQKQVQDILDNTGLDMCWHLAHLEGTLDGKPLGWKLLEGYNPEYRLDLHDPEQVARAKASFAASSAIRLKAVAPAVS